jgi:hypothetical protein
MRKVKHNRLLISRETLQRLDQVGKNEMRNAAGGAVGTRINCTTVTFTDWPTCDPIT